MQQQLYTSNLTANLARIAADVSLAIAAQWQPGNGRQTFRTTVAGQLVPTNVVANNMLYFFQPQFFTNAP